MTLSISGKTKEAKLILAELLDLSEEKYVSPYSFASIYVGLGEYDTAFEWLKKVVTEKSVWLIHMHIGSDRRFDRVRNDPRFKKLLKDINIES